MRSGIRRGLMASLLAVIGVAATGLPAAALPVAPGDDGGADPIEEPAPTPSATTIMRQIEDFSVSTNSVVATATLRYNGDGGSATVFWGDGSSTTRCPAGQEGPLHSGCLPSPFDADGAAGTLVFKHRYAAPANGAPFTVAINAKLNGESRTIATGVTPRYKVTVPSIAFAPLNDCDGPFEQFTEWHVSRYFFDLPTALPKRDWYFDRLDDANVVGGDPPLFQTLPDSGFSVELKASDNPYFVLDSDELDPIIDNALDRSFEYLNPLRGSRSVSLTTEESFLFTDAEPCRAEYRFDVDVRLLAPGLDGGPVGSQ